MIWSLKSQLLSFAKKRDSQYLYIEGGIKTTYSYVTWGRGQKQLSFDRLLGLTEKPIVFLLMRLALLSSSTQQ